MDALDACCTNVALPALCVWLNHHPHVWMPLLLLLAVLIRFRSTMREDAS